MARPMTAYKLFYGRKGVDVGDDIFNPKTTTPDEKPM